MKIHLCLLFFVYLITKDYRYFSLHRNGFHNNNEYYKLRDFKNIDEIIYKLGPEVYKGYEYNFTFNNKLLQTYSIHKLYTGKFGAKLYKKNGQRIMNKNDIDNYDDLFLVPRGDIFIWPLYYNGHIIKPFNNTKNVTLKQLSSTPRVFEITNFIDVDEINNMINFSVEKMENVNITEGHRDYYRIMQRYRDKKSTYSQEILKNTFKISNLENQSSNEDLITWMKYENESNYFSTHLDFSNPKNDGYDPLYNNGTNKVATMLIYLTNVTNGGETIFPLENNTINFEDLCKESSNVLKVKPESGKTIIFYNMKPGGELDYDSVHGSCPSKSTKIVITSRFWYRKYIKFF